MAEVGITTLLAAAASAASAGATYYAATKSGKPPKLESRPAMPSEIDEDALAASRREKERQRGMRGRDSTILTDAEPAAAPTYVTQELGS